MEGLQENQGNNLASWGMKPAKKASFSLATGTWVLAASPAVCDTSAKSCPPLYLCVLLRKMGMGNSSYWT